MSKVKQMLLRLDKPKQGPSVKIEKQDTQEKKDLV